MSYLRAERRSNLVTGGSVPRIGRCDIRSGIIALDLPDGVFGHNISAAMQLGGVPKTKLNRSIKATLKRLSAGRLAQDRTIRDICQCVYNVFLLIEPVE